MNDFYPINPITSGSISLPIIDIDVKMSKPKKLTFNTPKQPKYKVGDYKILLQHITEAAIVKILKIYPTNFYHEDNNQFNEPTYDYEIICRLETDSYWDHFGFESYIRESSLKDIDLIKLCSLYRDLQHTIHLVSHMYDQEENK